MTLRTAELSDDAPIEGYPFDLPVARAFPIEFSSGVTVFVGENGSGKSTLVEAIAVAAGFNPEGGSGHAFFETEATHSDLATHVRLSWRAARRLRPGWFLRAESFYNAATHRDHLPLADPTASYHRQSHGEAFLNVADDWFGQRYLFVLDEPEAALSFVGQLALITAIRRGVVAGAQFVIATHSPMLMSIPDALVYEIDDLGIHSRSPDELEVVLLWRSFLEAPSRFLRHLD